MKPHYSAVPKAVFNTEMDTFALNYLKRRDVPLPPNFNSIYASVMLSVGEAIMLAPRVTFKVCGENAVLATLTRMFGVAGVQQLLEEDAIEFVLWKSIVGGVINNAKLVEAGVLASGNADSPEHADPEVSCLKGMAWNPDLDATQSRSIAAKAARHTTLSPRDAAQQAVQAVFDAKNSGLLSDYGLEPGTQEIAPQAYQAMVKLASSLAESSILFEREWDLFEGEGTWSAMLRIAAEVRSGTSVLKTAEEILRLEQVPSVQSLLLEKTLSFSDLIELRKRPEARDFREWLWTRPDPADAKTVTDAYAALVAKDSKTKLIDRTWFKAARILGITFAGGLVGEAAAGPVGMAVGGSAGFIASNLAAAGISYSDLLVDCIRNGRNPRRFASFLRDQQIVKKPVN